MCNLSHVLASQVLLKGLGEPATVFSDMSIKTLFIIMGMAAVMRGVLHYAELLFLLLFPYSQPFHLKQSDGYFQSDLLPACNTVRFSYT